MNNQYQNKNQNNQNMQNAMNANAQANMENASELAQSNGEISRKLLAKSKAGFEFGKLGQSAAQNIQSNNYSNAAQQNQLEVDQLQGQTTQMLSQISKQS